MLEVLERWKQNMVEKDFITKTHFNNNINNNNNDNINGNENKIEILSASTKGNETLKVKIYAKKIHNKNVTIVEGLEKFLLDLKDVAKILAKHFACAVSIQDFSNTNTKAIFIQGYWVFELLEILQNEFKLNKQFIYVEDKLKLKSKKK